MVPVVSELGLTHLYRGKVRDLFAVDDDHLLMVASDRLSAFDVVMHETIPHKGRVLTALTNFYYLQRLPARNGDRLDGRDGRALHGTQHSLARDRQA